MGRFGRGQPVKRVEDARLLTGRGCYLDDIRTEGALHAAFVRSPHAHARILSLDTAAAATAPGVRGAFAGRDLAALGPMPCIAPMTGKGGKTQFTPLHPALAIETVRHVGEPVAFVVAETAEAARAAAELVAVEYESLPVVADLAAAAAGGALVWPEAGTNVSLDWEIGDRAATQAAFAKAAHVGHLELVNNRITAVPMETRGAIAEYDAASRRFTLHASSQGGHKLRAKLAHDIFHLPEQAFRIVTPDVGGGFGMKIYLYPEQIAALWAARALGRPVRWMAERAESFVSDTHARDQVTSAALALDAEGRFLAFRASSLANLGAYMSMYGGYIPTQAGHLIMPSIYDWPTFHAEVKCVFTHTVPVDAYRGAGKPETNYIVERLIDEGARIVGMAPAELRRLNAVPETAMPFVTATKMTVDSGAFADNIARVLEMADGEGFARRREAARARGRLRGFGVAAYMEDTVQRADEEATLSVGPKGEVLVLVGTQSNGQGHETTYAQLVAEAFDLDIAAVRVVQGDTDRVAYGNGTGGSRSFHAGGGAILVAAEKIVAKGRRIAAHILEAAPADVRFAGGQFVIAGTDRRAGFAEIAAAAHRPGALPADIEPGLEETARYAPAAHTFPNGVHVCEAEVDPETGHVALERYAVVDDFGVILNRAIVEGQVHGGVVQGLGQAMLEACVYDRDSGQLLAGSLMDYAIPRADDVPDFEVAFNEVPCATNPLGAKGCGEAGAIVAPSAAINAIVDALAPLGVSHVDMPATPERVWRAIGAAARLANENG